MWRLVLVVWRKPNPLALRGGLRAAARAGLLGMIGRISISHLWEAGRG